MPKKSFKDNTAHLDRFFSDTDTTQEPYNTQDEHRPQEPQGTQETHSKPEPSPSHPRYYRINLKLRTEHKDYLERVSWESHKSITQYLNDLIEADKDTKDA